MRLMSIVITRLLTRLTCSGDEAKPVGRQKGWEQVPAYSSWH